VLYYLKYIFIESDEGVVNRWVESAYWQFFCRKLNKYSASVSCTQHHSANGVTVSVIFLGEKAFNTQGRYANAKQMKRTAR